MINSKAEIDMHVCTGSQTDSQTQVHRYNDTIPQRHCILLWMISSHRV